MKVRNPSLPDIEFQLDDDRISTEYEDVFMCTYIYAVSGGDRLESNSRRFGSCVISFQ